MYSVEVWSLGVVEVWFFYALFPACLVGETSVFATTSCRMERERWIFCHKRASNSCSCVLILPFCRSHVADVWHWTIKIWRSKGIFVCPLKQQAQRGSTFVNRNIQVWSSTQFDRTMSGFCGISMPTPMVPTPRCLEAIYSTLKQVYPDQPNPLQVTAVVKYWWVFITERKW